MISENESKRHSCLVKRLQQVVYGARHILFSVAHSKVNTVALYLVAREHHKVGLDRFKRITDKFHRGRGGFICILCIGNLHYAEFAVIEFKIHFITHTVFLFILSKITAYFNITQRRITHKFIKNSLKCGISEKYVLQCKKTQEEEKMYRILIVEDDPGIAAAVCEQAQMWQLEVRCVTDFRNILADFSEFQPHIVLMDITLPFFNGYYWCGEIRKTSTVPIIFISSASDNMNIVMAVNMGADDFIAKPFNQSVLMAKITAMLRRTYDFASAAPLLEHREAILNTGDNTLTYSGEKIPLTKNEYRILLCLMENKGKPVSREKLMERLWETDSFVDENTLTVNINRLRKKLDTAGLDGFIKTKFGLGYIVE